MRVSLRLILRALVCWAAMYLMVLPRALHEMQDLGLPIRALWGRLPARQIPAAALAQTLALVGALLFLAGIVCFFREAGRRERPPRPSRG